MVDIAEEENFFGTFDGLVHYFRDEWKVYKASNSPLPHNGISTVEVAPSGTVWIGTTKGLVKKQGNNWKVYNTNNSKIPHNTIGDVAVDDDERVWVGTRMGLSVFNGEKWKSFTPTNSGLPFKAVGQVSIDPSGNKWLYGYHPFLPQASNMPSNEKRVSVYKDTAISRREKSAPDAFDFEFFPNPAKNHVILNFRNISEDVNYRLFTIDGKLVKSKQIQNPAKELINLGNFRSGPYILQVESKDLRETRKLIIK